MEKGSSGRLCLHRVETFGPHYSRTLRLWRQNFLDSFDGKIRPALRRKFTKMNERDLEIFSKKWEVCDAHFQSFIQILTD